MSQELRKSEDWKEKYYIITCTNQAPSEVNCYSSIGEAFKAAESAQKAAVEESSNREFQLWRRTGYRIVFYSHSGTGVDLNTAMKQRLVGTVVIGCLAIIFIPALLDGEGVSPPEMTSSMPAPPAMPEVPVIQQERPEITADTLSASEPDADEQAAAPPSQDTDTAPLLRHQRRKDQS